MEHDAMDNQMSTLMVKAEVMTQKFDDLKDSFEKHMKEDSDNFGFIRGDIKVIKENHLTHIEKDINIMQTNMGWIKSFQWIIVSGVVALIIRSFWPS